MELKEFIKLAVSDITSAVSELQSELKNGAVVNLYPPLCLPTIGENKAPISQDSLR